MNIHGEPLRRLTGAIFAAAGCAEDEAARVARYLVEANMTGPVGIVKHIKRYSNNAH